MGALPAALIVLHHPASPVRRRTQSTVASHSQQPARPEMLTVAIRGPLASKMRELAETTGRSLAELLKDALLVHEGDVEGGHEQGTALADWGAQQREQGADT